MDRSPSTEALDQESMEAVRELLFGKKESEIDQRFKRLERDLISTVQRIEDRLERKIESLEGIVESAANELNQKIIGEKKERSSQNRDLTELIEAHREVTGKKFSETESLRRKKESKLRRLIEDESAELSREISKTSVALKERIVSEIEKVRDEHLDLEEMGKLLVGLGKKLDPTQSPASTPKKLNERKGTSSRPNMVKLSR